MVDIGMQQHSYGPATSGVLVLRASIYILKSDWNADCQETQILTQTSTHAQKKNATVFLILMFTSCCKVI